MGDLFISVCDHVVMPLPSQLEYCSQPVRLFVHPFVCYQSCEPVLMSIGTNGQWGKDMKHLTLEFKSTDVKVIQG